MKIHMTPEDHQARFLRCIGEPTRLQIIRLLVSGEKCVCEIMAALDKEQSLVSHHLRILKGCNIVLMRQQAQNVYYRLSDPRLAELVIESQYLMQELSLCQWKGGCCDEAED